MPFEVRLELQPDLLTRMPILSQNGEKVILICLEMIL
jgi:hypothetical protein